MSFRSTQTIKRTEAGTYVAGRYVAGAETLVPIIASVQPLSGKGKTQVTVPEGVRVEDMIRVYTDFEVRPGAEGGAPPDRITWRGAEYECHSVEHWQSGVLPHFKAIFSKVKQ